MNPPLIFVPGLLCDERLWSYQVEYLANITAPMVADVTGGNSVTGIARSVLKRAPERFALAGLSMGGYVALEVMRMAPERVERLALLDTSARPDAPEQTEARLELLKLAELGRFEEVLQRLLPRLVHPDRLANHDLTSTVLDMARAVGPEAFARQERAIIMRPDSREDLASIECPTLVLCGREDEITPLRLHEEIFEGIPGATLRVIDGCGHLSPLERPDEVNEAIVGWLEQTAR